MAESQRAQAHRSRDAAADIGRLLASLNPEKVGAQMHGLVRELYPICRSITGEGLRRTLRLLQRTAPIELHEVASGTQVFDWQVPREWNLRSARLTAPDGTVIADAERQNLHVLNYSVPFRGKVPLEELEKHLHSLPDKPQLVPYRTSYYRDDWGFCLAHREREALRPGDYQVDIDATLAPGSLTYGELALPGESPEEVLLSAHCCHPSLANDNLSGIAIAATLASLLRGLPLRYTYRFLFVPGTIGAITWLALNEARARRVRHGLVLACLGDDGSVHYKRSRRGDAVMNRACAHVLSSRGQPHEVRDFTPYGYDERQYCSPGFDLSVGSLSRTPYGEYPEYHTSADNPGLVKPDRLFDSLRACLEVFRVLEGDRRYLNLSPKCEPQLGKRGLYGSVGGQSHAAPDQMSMLWVLSRSDGRSSLLDVAEKAKVPFEAVHHAAMALEAAGLLKELPADELAAGFNGNGESGRTT